MTRSFLPVALALALMSAAMAIPACAHTDPAKFATCMQDSSAGAALINAVNDILDGDNRTHVLEQLAIAIGPDVFKCALEQVAARKGAGPTGDVRSLRAREYLDSHGGHASLGYRADEAEVLYIDGPPLQADSVLTFRMALPFEYFDAGWYVSTGNPYPCPTHMHDLSPYAPGRACASNDYTVVDEQARVEIEHFDSLRSNG